MAQQNSSEEVDLGYLFKKFNNFLKSIFRSLFTALDFFKSHIIIVIALIIVGFGIGYYKDNNSVEVYNNEVLLIPNFESVDYLYDKVKTINLKIAAKDTVYLKGIFGTNLNNIRKIELAPINDIYNFVSKSRQNIDVLKIISQKQDFSDYVKDMSTSKYFKYHKMNISILGKDSSKKIVDDLFIFLNKNQHFKKYQNILKETKDFQVKEYYTMLSQIDTIIKSNTSSNISSSVSVNTISNQSDLIEKKRQLLADLQNLEMEQNDYTDIIKLVSEDYNIPPEKLFDFSNKFKYPLFLLLLFSGIFFIIYCMKKLREYSYSNE